jgi:pyruvate ferredoxin oxidoreductase alpha subunit
MRVQIEGSQAVAQVVALCKPEVIAAYPISPQTHIVERLSRKVKQGGMECCQFPTEPSQVVVMTWHAGTNQLRSHEQSRGLRG